MRINYVYKDTNGEYFIADEDDKNQKEFVLKNPSYPFSFTPSALGKLEEIGPAKEFGHLVKKEDYIFYEGEELSVHISEDGNLEVVDNNS